jgi:hypothetical protein
LQNVNATSPKKPRKKKSSNAKANRVRTAPSPLNLAARKTKSPLPQWKSSRFSSLAVYSIAKHQDDLAQNAGKEIQPQTTGHAQQSA